MVELDIRPISNAVISTNRADNAFHQEIELETNSISTVTQTLESKARFVVGSTRESVGWKCNLRWPPRIFGRALMLSADDSFGNDSLISSALDSDEELLDSKVADPVKKGAVE